jgi:hypothetical protein
MNFNPEVEKVAQRKKKGIIEAKSKLFLLCVTYLALRYSPALALQDVTVYYLRSSFQVDVRKNYAIFTI